MNNEKEFEDISSMTKDESVKEVKRFFKGNKKFIEQATIIIGSTCNFKKISRMAFQKDNYDWEKFMTISIDTELGFKTLTYRKGNTRYAPTTERKGNTTHDIEDSRITIYNTETRKVEEYYL